MLARRAASPGGQPAAAAAARWRAGRAGSCLAHLQGRGEAARRVWQWAPSEAAAGELVTATGRSGGACTSAARIGLVWRAPLTARQRCGRRLRRSDWGPAASLQHAVSTQQVPGATPPPSKVTQGCRGEHADCLCQAWLELPCPSAGASTAPVLPAAAAAAGCRTLRACYAARRRHLRCQRPTCRRSATPTPP